MKFNYVINAADFLEYYLYMVSKSPAISRKRNIVKYSFSGIYMFFAIYFFYSGMVGMGYFFMLLANLWFFFYPKLNLKALERYYAKYTQENFGHQMDRPTEMTIQPDLILINDGKIASEIQVSDFEILIEIKNSFFLREKSGNTFIIPKNLIDTESFVSEISKTQIPLKNETNWLWK